MSNEQTSADPIEQERRTIACVLAQYLVYRINASVVARIEQQLERELLFPVTLSLYDQVHPDPFALIRVQMVGPQGRRYTWYGKNDVRLVPRID
jgi:hypothetical protein